MDAERLGVVGEDNTDGWPVGHSGISVVHQPEVQGHAPGASQLSSRLSAP